MQPSRLAVLSFAAAIVLASSHSGSAQQPQLPQLRPPPPAPIRPFQTVAVKPPPPFDDSSFATFRKQLGDVAAHKDRTALARLVVTQNFFWFQDKDVADKHKSGIDNLAKAIDLDGKDGPGWDILTAFANEPSAIEAPDQKGTFCAPADPVIDPNAFQALSSATGTDPSEWGYPSQGAIDVHAGPQPSSPVIEKVGSVLIHVLPDSSPPTSPNAPPVLHVATPSGKSGYVDATALAPLVQDQICYRMEAGNWKIAGYLGGPPQ